MGLEYTRMGGQFAHLQEEIGHYWEEKRVRDQRIEEYRAEQQAAFQRMEELRQADLHRYEEDYRRTYGPMYSYIPHHMNFSSMDAPPPLNGVTLEVQAPVVGAMMAG
ncbi:unnamed protein product [Cuscuta europaea]|uniref:Uncharacterized protein n=1 Tax=Cuscuta europaea TaxID=41803 RepID=A0A9P1EDQ2_CUSEU|nr:unnamed protein product [Cuscuta europaea]